VLSVANAGPLLQPRGQTSVLYTVPPADSEEQQQEEEGTRRSRQTNAEADTAAAEKQSPVPQGEKQGS
jgi:hypothetical protein